MNSKRNRKKEGFLQVKLSSRSTLGKAWKRKWVVVQQNTSSTGKSLLLELYMEKGAYHKTVTSLLLEDVVSVRRAKSKKQEHAIEISSSSKTLLGVGADSETETQDWLSMFQFNLLPPIKELMCPPGIPQDFVRVSVIPNKDSERLKLGGDYFAHISLASINLYDTCTGEIALEWDLRHLKKFMLISKCHPLDVEKIVHILPSKRSPKGEGEFIFFSTKGKQLVEGIYERLSCAMTVKSRRSRSTSMLFEITPQELEQMFKETEQPPEETVQEVEEETSEVNSETKEGGVNGDTSEEVSPSSKEIESNRVDIKDEKGTEKVKQATNEIKEDVTEEKDEAAELTDETNLEEDKVGHTDDKIEQVEEAENDVKKQNGEAGQEVDETAPTANLEDVAKQLGNVNTTSGSQDAVINHSDEEKIYQDDEKANQTNLEEMDECIEADVSPSPGQTVEEHTISNDEFVVLSQDEPHAEVSVKPVTSTEPVETDRNQECSPNVITAESSVNVESGLEAKGEIVVSTDSDQCQDTPMGDSVATNNQEDANEVHAEENEAISSWLETQPIASPSSLQETHEATEDGGGENKEPVSDSPESTTSKENLNQDIQETNVTEESTAEIKTSSDINEEQDQSTEPNEDPPTMTGESAHGEQIGTDLVEQSQEQSQSADYLEITNEHPATEFNLEADLGTDATVISPETETVAESHEEISEQSPPDIDKKSMDNTPQVDAMISIEPAEPINTASELSGNAGDSNPNHNNSNSNESVRRNNKTVPLPNTLTSRMAEALRNAQKRKLFTDTSSPSQETD